MEGTNNLSLATKYVDIFLTAIKADYYPPEDTEKVFGVVMSPTSTRVMTEASIGQLVFNVWIGLFKMSYFNRNDLIKELCNGSLPQFFESKVKQIHDVYAAAPAGNLERLGVYIPELLRRGFSEIPWDTEIHDKLKMSIYEIPKNAVKGLRIVGSNIIPENIMFDSSFEKCPIAHAAGIPLYVKRLPIPGVKSDNYIIVRMMSEPAVGLAPMDWQYGARGIAPPVLVVRSDQVPFTELDWEVLDDFEIAMLDDGPRSVNRFDFLDFAELYDSHDPSSKAIIMLEALYPKGKLVKAINLVARSDLNGCIGRIVGRYKNGRVGVKFNNTVDNIVALKPENFSLMEFE